jgi:AcrR family transcriptional regulator
MNDSAIMRQRCDANNGANQLESIRRLRNGIVMVNATNGRSQGSAGSDTRRRILIEASRLLSVHGYHGTTTREIAAAVGISQPSLFFHFPTKRAIVEELYEFDLVPAVEGLENLVVSGGTPAAKLYAMVVGEMSRIIDSPYDMRAHISYEVLSDPDLATFRDLVNQFDDLTRLLIRSGQEAGQFIEGDPWLAQQLVSGFLARANLFATTDQVKRRSHPEESASLILRSLLADPEALEEVSQEAAGLLPKYDRQH